jgi:hypothetical protein
VSVFVVVVDIECLLTLCFAGLSADTSTTTGEAEVAAATAQSDSDNTTLIVAIVVALVVVAVVASGVVGFLYWRKKNATETSAELIPLQSNWKTITDIKILERLGGGNFGEVYRGIWQSTTFVALKKLKDAEHYKEFEREASMLGSAKLF